MPRTRSIRCTENTNVIQQLEKIRDGNVTTHENPCMFRGLLIVSTNSAADVGGNFSVYENNIGSGFTVPAAVATSASNKTITLSSGTWLNRGLRVGMVITISSSDESDNDGDKTITALTETVITVSETMADDASDTGMVIDIKGGDTVGLIAKFAYKNMGSSGGAGGNSPTELFEFDGILCREGLRIESSSWSNLEAYILVE
jgi:hypothetical protein